MQNNIWTDEMVKFEDKLRKTNLLDIIQEELEIISATEIMYVMNSYIECLCLKAIRTNKKNEEK